MVSIRPWNGAKPKVLKKVCKPRIGSFQAKALGLLLIPWMISTCSCVQQKNLSAKAMHRSPAIDALLNLNADMAYRYADGCPWLWKTKENLKQQDAYLNLVSRGPAQVHDLIEHLADTRIVAVSPPDAWGTQGRNLSVQMYDFNVKSNRPRAVAIVRHDERPLPSRPSITVADLCFTALGGIVNRHFVVSLPRVTMDPERWNDTSPHSPVIRATLEEWGSATADTVHKSLVYDFMFPDTLDRAAIAIGTIATFWPREVARLLDKKRTQLGSEGHQGKQYLQELSDRISDMGALVSVQEKLKR